MKRALLLCGLVTLLLVLFAGSAFALHTQDIQGSRCYRCHSTHQSQSPLLLQDVSGYDVVTPSTNCMMCHDGTSGRTVTHVGGQYAQYSGFFDIQAFMDGSMPINTSAHAVDLTEDYFTNITTAPGNKNLAHYDAPNNAGRLSCASCHNPHGTLGSHKYLQLNPNDSIDGKFYSGTNAEWVAALDAKPEVATVTLTRQADGTYAGAESAPWLRSYVMGRGAVANHYVKYPVAIQVGDQWWFNRQPGSVSTVNFTVNSIDGVIRFDGEAPDPVTAELTAKVFLPIQVQQAGTFVGEYFEEGVAKDITVRTYKSGNYGNDMNRWCAACHGNFDIANRNRDTYEIDGVTHYGHNVYRGWNQSYATPYTVLANGNAQSNCLSCHFAHGTSIELMWDSNKQVIGSNENVAGFGSSRGARNDAAPANKRYFGGSVCLRCHYDSHGYLFIWDNDLRQDEWRFQ